MFKPEIDLTEVLAKKPPRHFNNCKVIDLDPDGTAPALPRPVEIRLPGADGPLALAMWHGQPEIAVNDFVRARRDSSDTVMVIEGFGGSGSQSLATTQALSAEAFGSGQGSPAQSTLGDTVTSFQGLFTTWLLDAAATESVSAGLPYIGDQSGSTVNVTIWAAMASATSGNVVITADCASLASGEAAGTVGASASSPEAVPGTAGLLFKATLAVTVSYVSGDILRLTIGREGGDGSDTASGDMHFVGAVVEFA